MTATTHQGRDDRIHIRLEAHCSVGHFEVVGVLTNISYSGALIDDTSMQPEIGTPIVLYVYLEPPSAFKVVTPFELTGQVVRHSSTGFAIEYEDNLDPDVRQMVDDAVAVVAGPLRDFMALNQRRRDDGLSPADMVRWSQLKDTLHRHFEPDVEEQHAQSRASVRVPLVLNVNFESRGEVHKCLMTNLSAGGLFVATESPLPIDTRFNVRIRVRKTGEEIELPGEVVSVEVNANLTKEERGMGIRFLNLDDAQREQVAELYEHAIKTAIEDAGGVPFHKS
jgi:type IV pilus assembly protein PilZ